jgi:phosphatidylinositol glycan class V
MRMERQVIRFAAASRACVSLLAALSAWLVPPYDTSSQLLAGGGDGSGGASLAAAFGNWDGVYFAHIARAGYEYEHFHAFFPLYPALVRLVR